MMSLLEKASIITTPTAYDDGKLLSVKPVQTFGSELVTNGDFDTDTDWTKGAAWTINNGTANYNDSSTSPVYQNITLNANYYQLKFSISNSSGSGASIWIGNSSGSVSYTDNTYQYYTNGNYTLTINVPSNQSTLTFYGNVQGSSFSIDNVSVKETIDGDFSFQRGSSATRVNEQGLVQDVQILSDNLVQNGDFEEIGSEEVSNGDFEQIGSELVTNGDFATDSDWAKQLGWSISGGVAIGTNASSSYLYQGVGIQSNKTYKITFDLVSITNGSIVPVLNGTPNTIGDEVNSVGTYTQYLKAGSNANGNISIKAVSNFSGSIDNVSVKEVGQDWIYGTGWSISGGLATCTGTNENLLQSNVGNVNKNYKLVFSISNYVSGSVRPAFVGQYSQSIDYNANGTYVAYISSLSDLRFVFYSNSFIGSIDNVSVKEVGQNWTFGTGWSMGDGKASRTSQSSSSLLNASSTTLIVGRLYKCTMTVSNYSSGLVRFATDNVGFTSYTSNGTFVEYLVATGTAFNIKGNSDFTGSIDNISVIEITNDTDLPRINYTNFDYQDVLGDELVTNGDFDTDSDWTLTGATINGGKVNVNSSSPVYIIQSNVATVGKLYKVELTVSNYVEGDLRLRYPFTISESEFTGNGTYVFYGTAEDARFELQGRFSGQTYNFSIDNVSVKEFTEDVLVPYSGEGSLKLEPQSTNLVTYSEDFSNAAWSKTGATTVTSNTVISPDGTLNGSTISGLTGSGSNDIYFITGINPANKTYSFSVYLKGEGTLRLQFSNNVNQGLSENITLTSDWKRHTVTGTFNSTSGNLSVTLDDSTATATQFDAWGVMLEENSFATSYIPTQGSIKTRLQDICNNAGSSDLINSTEGVLYAEISALSSVSYRAISLSNNTNSNVVSLLYRLAQNEIWMQVRGNGVETNIKIYDFNQLQNNKIAIKYKQNDFALWVNGVEKGTNNSGSTPIVLNTLKFQRGDGNESFYGNVKCVAVFKEALSDTELACLTS